MDLSKSASCEASSFLASSSPCKKNSADLRFRNWSFLIYPDSAPSNFKDVLTSFHVPLAISPLHDHDIDDRDPTQYKKPHYHCIITFSGKQSFDQVKALSSQLSGVQPFRCLSVIGLYRYFIHLDNPEKWQYDSAEIRHFNGFKVPKDCLCDPDLLLDDILNFVIDNRVSSFAYLAQVAREQFPGWNRVLLTKNCYYIGKVIDSFAKESKDYRILYPADLKPEDRKAWLEKQKSGDF